MAHSLIFRNVWADETGSDKRDAIRKLGYALRGVRPVCQRILCRGQRINAVAISTRGVVATDMTLSTINGEFFYLRGTLLPQMMVRTQSQFWY